MTEHPVSEPEGLRVSHVGLLGTVVILFILVSSGAFGLEDMVSSSGPGFTILMLVLLPVFFALPVALVCAELGSALPEEGGYYRWAYRTMGEFWGFQSGWWSWTSSWVDSAVYITLVQAYVSGWWPQLNGFELWLIGAALIAFFAYVNIRGLDIVAFGSLLFTIVILAPFAVLTFLGFAHWHGSPFSPFIPTGQSFFSSANLGLAVGVWMYSGYDGIGTMAGEIRNPQRVIPRALMIIVPVVALSYILPTMAGLAGWGHWSDWASETGGTSFVQLAQHLGGPILGYIMLGAAVLSNMALYQDWMGPGSRPTYMMAQDRLLPPVFCKVHRKYGTPWVAILVLAGVNAVLIITTFANLVVIDIFLTMFYYFLIFASALILRRKEPNLARPFRIWGNTAALALISAPAVAIMAFTIYQNATDTSIELFGLPAYFVGGALAALAGPVAYVIFKRIYGGRNAEPPGGPERRRPTEPPVEPTETPVESAKVV